MASGKLIGGFLGFIVGGPLGALAGWALGWIFDQGLQANTFDTDTDGTRGSGPAYNEQRLYEGQRNSFIFSLLVLASYIIRADGRIMHSEMEVVRRFLRQNFGEQAVKQGEDIILRLFEQQKQMGMQRFARTIDGACAQMAANMDYSQRLQLLHFLVIIAQADGVVVKEEVEALRQVAMGMGISATDLASMLNLDNGCSNLDAAYKVLGIAPTATDDEVKAAYRKMALKHHPDRVATLGDDVRLAAEKKFQEINEAKSVIYKARGL